MKPLSEYFPIIGAVAGSAFMINRSSVPLTNKYALLMMAGSAFVGPTLTDAVTQKIDPSVVDDASVAGIVRNAVGGGALTYAYMYFMGM